MNRSKKLQQQIEIIHTIEGLPETERGEYLRRNPTQKNVYYRYRNQLETLQAELLFHKRWPEILNEQVAILRENTIPQREQLAATLIQDELGQQFSLPKMAIRSHLQQLFADYTVTYTRPVKEPARDINPLLHLWKPNASMERLQTELDLRSFQIERVIGLGYLSPFPQHNPARQPPRFRADLVVLSGPWHNIEAHPTHTGQIIQEVWHHHPGEDIQIRYRSLSKGHPDTHRTGVLTLVLTPCFIEQDVGKQRLTLPRRDFHAWDIQNSLDLERLQAQLRLIDDFCISEHLPRVLDDIHPEHPFHPNQLKRTIERHPELIYSAKHRITYWNNLDKLRNDVIAPYLSPLEYIQRYTSRYSYTPPSLPRKVVQEYFETHYKTTSTSKDPNLSLELQERLKRYRERGFTSKTILLSHFFPFADPTELSFHIGMACTSSFPEYINHQVHFCLYNYSAEEQSTIPCFQSTITSNLIREKWDSAQLGFGSLRFEITDQSSISNLYYRGTHIIQENGRYYFDIVGLLPSIELQNTAALQKAQEQLIQQVCPKISDDETLPLLKRFDFSQVRPVFQQDGRLCFDYICLNAAYWPLAERKRLLTHQPLGSFS